MLLLGGVGLLIPSQIGDLLAFLGQRRTRPGPDIAFHAALIVFGLNAWYWARAALAAQFGVTDRKRTVKPVGTAQVRAGQTPRDVDGWIYEWLPRLLFLLAIGIGIALMVREHRWENISIAAIYALVVTAMLVLRPGAKDGPLMPPPQLPGTLTLGHVLAGMGQRLLALLRRAPHGLPCAGPLLALSVALFILAGAQSFSHRGPRENDLGSFLAYYFPGPAVAVLLLGLMIGPLTALVFVGDGFRSTVPILGRNFGLPRVPVLVAFAAWVFWYVPKHFDVHTVRVTDKPSKLFQDGGKFADNRWSLDAIFEQWARTCYPKPPSVLRPIIVAVSGGATRAGLWGAAVLRQVEQAQIPGGPALFAVSSISGGSLGVAGVMALLAAQSDPCHASRALDPLIPGDGNLPVPLAGDALAPLLGGWLASDVPRAFLAPFVAAARWAWPDGSPAQLRGGDSAEALERAFVRLWDKVPCKGKAPGFDEPFLSLFYDEKGAFRPGMPIWIANGTDVTTGNRMITTPIASRGADTSPETWPFEAWPFRSARDVLYLLRSDVPIATAINNTARFPFLEPFGELLPRSDARGETSMGSLIDGGYFDNEGLLSALELASWLEGRSTSERPVEPIIVEVTGDGEDLAHPLMSCDETVDGPRIGGEQTGGVSQLLAPLFGLFHTRGGHSAALLRQAHDQLCQPRRRFFHFYLPANGPTKVPLNWVLSDDMARFVLSDGRFKPYPSPLFHNDQQLELLRAALRPDQPEAAAPPARPPRDAAQSGQRCRDPALSGSRAADARP